MSINVPDEDLFRITHSYEVNLSKDTKVDQVSSHIAADLLRDLLKMENKEHGKYEIRYEIVEKG